MKTRLVFRLLLLMAVFLTRTAVASTTWYVNGVSGSNSNTCTSPTTACKTIKHAIALASSGDSIIVAAATYTENLTLGFSLNVIGSGASTTIIDGGALNTVITISNAAANVIVSKVKIQNGSARCGGGIYNVGTVTINSSIITRNLAATRPAVGGGGICNSGAMTLNNSTVSGNQANGNIELFVNGGGILNGGTLTINRSTISGNTLHDGEGGGIANDGTATINDSTISANNGFLRGGGVISAVTTAKTTINNSTIASNTTDFSTEPAGIDLLYGTMSIQNSIVANNSGGNCFGTLTSKGYNLSSDATCNLSGPGDRNNINPMLGPLQNNGGPTQTMALLEGSPAIDAGNPTGCTDGLGHLLKTDQRGNPRPNIEDTGGCDMGAYERQSD
jgi:hypothetical protein